MLAAIDEADLGRRPVRVFLTADEEQGSRTAREPLRDVVDGVAAAFVVEPPGASGNLKTSRKGLGRLRIAGRRPSGPRGHESCGRGECSGGARAPDHPALTRANGSRARRLGDVGTITGGTTENVVAAHAEADSTFGLPASPTCGPWKPPCTGSSLSSKERRSASPATGRDRRSSRPPRRARSSARHRSTPPRLVSSWARWRRAAAPTRISSRPTEYRCSMGSGPRAAAPTAMTSTSGSTHFRCARGYWRAYSKAGSGRA